MTKYEVIAELKHRGYRQAKLIERFFDKRRPCRAELESPNGSTLAIEGASWDVVLRELPHHHEESAIRN
jgi:hypothetical protein